MKKLIRNNGPSYHFSTDIPECYDRLTLRILQCTPQTMYAYWDIPVQLRIDNNNLQLRMTAIDQITGEIKFESYLPLRENKNSCYLDIPFSGYPFYIEIGMLDDENNFTIMCTTEQQPFPFQEPVFHEQEITTTEDQPPSESSTENPYNRTMLKDTAPTGPQHKDTAPTGPQHKDTAPTGPQHKDTAPTGPHHKVTAPTGPQHKDTAPTGPHHKVTARLPHKFPGMAPCVVQQLSSSSRFLQDLS